MELLTNLITIVQIFKHTPLWVWALFVILVLLGYMQSKPRLISRQRAVVLPAAMLALSLNGIATTFGPTLLFIGLWGAVAIAVVLANLALRFPRGVTYSAATNRVSVPGSWAPFAFMMLIFFIKYTVAVQIALNPERRREESFAMIVCALYGICSGIFLARSVEILRMAKRTSSETSVTDSSVS